MVLHRPRYEQFNGLDPQWQAFHGCVVTASDVITDEVISPYLRLNIS
jgi:hypothetical protein